MGLLRWLSREQCPRCGERAARTDRSMLSYPAPPPQGTPFLDVPYQVAYLACEACGALLEKSDFSTGHIWRDLGRDEWAVMVGPQAPPSARVR